MTKGAEGGGGGREGETRAGGYSSLSVPMEVDKKFHIYIKLT